MHRKSQIISENKLYSERFLLVEAVKNLVGNSRIIVRADGTQTTIKNQNDAASFAVYWFWMKGRRWLASPFILNLAVKHLCTPTSHRGRPFNLALNNPWHDVLYLELKFDASPFSSEFAYSSAACARALAAWRHQRAWIPVDEMSSLCKTPNSAAFTWNRKIFDRVYRFPPQT